LPSKLFYYEVIDFIGQGAGSLIYAVSHPQTHQLYALKHVVKKVEKDERFIEQLEAECAVGTSVNHPGLRRSIEMKYTRVGVLRKVTEAALVMELFDGSSLESSPPTKLTDIVDTFVQTAKALDALHFAGYVHCDLKPNNILRNHSNQVKVIDLGQACKLNTKKERIQGTPDYISPEQVKCEPVTVRTDVYNFGATLYGVLTGKNVPTLFTVKRSGNSFLIDSGTPAPHDLNPQVPETLSSVVMECVRINPAKRPAGMADVARRLETILYVLQRIEGGQQQPNAGGQPQPQRCAPQCCRVLVRAERRRAAPYCPTS